MTVGYHAVGLQSTTRSNVRQRVLARVTVSNCSMQYNGRYPSDFAASRQYVTHNKPIVVCSCASV